MKCLWLPNGLMNSIGTSEAVIPPGMGLEDFGRNIFYQSIVVEKSK